MKGWRDLERKGRWLLAILLVLTQVHLCTPEYVLPNGLTCQTCPTLKDKQTRIADTHGDCHDCCTIDAGCDQDDDNQKVVAAPFHFDPPVALPSTLTLEIPTLGNETAPTPILEEGCPPTGPPRDTASRAPPFSSLA